MRNHASPPLQPPLRSPRYRTATHASAHSNNADTNIPNVNTSFAQAASTSSATAHHPHATQVDNTNHATISIPATPSFLSIPTEVRCMIYDYLCTPRYDVHSEPTTLSNPNTSHPVFGTNHEIRAEAIHNLQRKETPTLCFHTAAKDLDYRKIASALKDPDGYGYFAERGAGGVMLCIRLTFRHEPNRIPMPFLEECCDEYIACLRKLDLEGNYEKTLADSDGKNE